MVAIWHQSFTDFTHLPHYAKTLRAHGGQILGDDGVVQPFGVRAGTYSDAMAPIDVIKYPYLEFLGELQVCEAALTAEREGFDAFAIGCFFDPGLKQARSIVDIPVVSLSEACLMVTPSIAGRFGCVTLCAEETESFERMVRVYRTHDRVAGLRALEPAVDEFALDPSSDSADKVVESFVDAGEELVGAGAEVIVPADGVLNELLFAKKVRSVNGVPVLDANALLWLYAEMLVRLQRSTQLSASRVGIYRKPPRDLLEWGRSVAGLSVQGMESFSR